MKPTTGKAKAIRAMRVATIFTGAAAAAAVFTPAAHAAQIEAKDGKTLAPRPTHRLAIKPMDQEGKQSGSIQMTSNCKTHWLNISGEALTFLGATKANWCFGYHGTYDVSSGYFGAPWTIYRECGGNNYGFLNPDYASYQSFKEGKTYRPEYSYQLNSVYIGGWAGTDNC